MAESVTYFVLFWCFFLPHFSRGSEYGALYNPGVLSRYQHYAAVLPIGLAWLGLALMPSLKSVLSARWSFPLLIPMRFISVCLPLHHCIVASPCWHYHVYTHQYCRSTDIIYKTSTSTVSSEAYLLLVTSLDTNRHYGVKSHFKCQICVKPNHDTRSCCQVCDNRNTACTNYQNNHNNYLITCYNC